MALECDAKMAVRRCADRLLIILFLGLISVPGLVQFLGSTATTEMTEKRKPAPLPCLEFSGQGLLPLPRRNSLETFPVKFEAYFNDHFGFRRPLLQAYSLAKLTGLAPGTPDNPALVERSAIPVIVGRQGWLYYAGDRRANGYRGTDPFRPAELEGWKQLFLQRRDWLAQRGIRYLITIPPEKQTIYPEYLPRSARKAGRSTRLDQLLEALRVEPGLEIVDLRQALRLAKSQYLTYYLTDTHWNDFGAFIGYQEILKGLRRCFPEAHPAALTDFEVRVGVPGAATDLRVMLDAPVSLKDVSVELDPRHKRQARAERPGDPRLPWSSRNPAAPLPHAVVFFDSFFNALMPYFNEHWQQVTYAPDRSFDCEIIENEQPEIVIQELVERALMNEIPQNPVALREFPAGGSVPVRPLAKSESRQPPF